MAGESQPPALAPLPPAPRGPEPAAATSVYSLCSASPDFASWLIGADYSRARHFCVGRRRRAPEDSEARARRLLRLAERREALKQLRRRPCRQHHAPRHHRVNKLSKLARAPDDDVDPTTRPPSGRRGTAADPSRKMVLKQALIGQCQLSSNVSLFPPLMTPYNHSHNLYRGWDSQLRSYYDNVSPRAASAGMQAELSMEEGDAKPALAPRPPQPRRPEFSAARRHYGQLPQQAADGPAAAGESLPKIAPRPPRGGGGGAAKGETTPSQPLADLLCRMPRQAMPLDSQSTRPATPSGWSTHAGRSRAGATPSLLPCAAAQTATVRRRRRLMRRR
eukprot:TRINITY_DN5481_c0_g1_i1.p1 TRINITY_DN5481_c0_g1~~TRINITY_DN5481_c0_g1_i1.p1  ORF type:complete len:334 (+),score=86.15 TRINITY_DN5481_c0_g1_i1:52-1053(+)